MTETEKQLLIESNELRFRLIETKMRLDALRYSEADTILVSDGAGEKQTLPTPIEAPYRIIIEEMKEGTCTLSKEGTIMYCNQRFADFLAIPMEQIVGSNFTKLVSVKNKVLFQLLLKARRNGTSNGEIKYVRHPDMIRNLFLSVRTIPSDLPGELIIIGTDITEIKQKGLKAEELLVHGRLAALNIMEDEIAAKNELEKTNKKLVEEIRERKKASCALHQSQHDLLQAQQMAHLGNWSYDLASKRTTCSKEIYHIMGIDPKLFILGDKEFKKIIHPDDWQRVTDTVRDSIEQCVIKELELRIIQRSNGEACTVYIICTPQLNSAGKTTKLNGIIQDITDRKQAEKELIKANRLYTVISQINQMVVRNQIHENIFNEACHIAIDYGKFRMAWIGLVDEKDNTIKPVAWAGAEQGYLSIIKAISTNNMPEGNGPTGLAIRNGELYYCNDVATDPNMEIWRDDALKRNYLSIIALPIIVHNKTIGAFTIYVSEPNFFNQSEIDLLLQVTTDISFALEVAETEKKRVEAEKAINNLNAELEQRVSLRTMQLEHTNKELQAFTYSVSHDLRSPLHNINGWSQVLLEECKDQLGENGCTYLDRVVIETKRMSNLIDDLLKLSKVTLIEKKRETVDLTTIAQMIVKRLQDQPIDHDLEFIIQPGLVTIGDSRMLDIALTNLLDNAFKFTGKQPQARIEFGKSIIDNKSTYWVRDNGIGFDMAHSKNLFGAFQRMHKQTDFPGTGIGLATVQRIIHRHNGLIWAESKIDQGTTFYFTIPEDIQ